jgi:hypothetical protein
MADPLSIAASLTALVQISASIVRYATTIDARSRER